MIFDRLKKAIGAYTKAHDQHGHYFEAVHDCIPYKSAKQYAKDTGAYFDGDSVGETLSLRMGIAIDEIIEAFNVSCINMDSVFNTTFFVNDLIPFFVKVMTDEDELEGEDLICQHIIRGGQSTPEYDTAIFAGCVVKVIDTLGANVGYVREDAATGKRRFMDEYSTKAIADFIALLEQIPEVR